MRPFFSDATTCKSFPAKVIESAQVWCSLSLGQSICTRWGLHYSIILISNLFSLSNWKSIFGHNIIRYFCALSLQKAIKFRIQEKQFALEITYYCAPICVNGTLVHMYFLFVKKVLFTLHTEPCRHSWHGWVGWGWGC